MTSGQVVDYIGAETPPGSLVVFRYEVGGVQYEASQDLTPLSQELGALQRPGLPALIRYDPANPGNSIVACEGWSGLHVSPPRPTPA